MNKDNVKTLRALISGTNARVRVGTGCRKGHIHVDMKFGSNRAQREVAFNALVSLNTRVLWGVEPKDVADVFASAPHHFDSVTVISFVGSL